MIKGGFEWRPSILRHKVVEAIEDDPVRKIKLSNSKHMTAVTNGLLTVLSNLNKPSSGFESLDLHFEFLRETLSKTVLDQFTSHCRNLQYLRVSGERFHNSKIATAKYNHEHRYNLCDLLTNILEVQNENKMGSLVIQHLDKHWLQENLPN